MKYYTRPKNLNSSVFDVYKIDDNNILWAYGNGGISFFSEHNTRLPTPNTSWRMCGKFESEIVKPKLTRATEEEAFLMML